jgi:DNA-binding CsgD family transcriptional regulator/tetratricopeptide (TPR) repeat protein
LGRSEEQRAIGDVLAAVRAGGSGALVLTGDAGMGKSTLLDHVVESATDFRVARISGVESETEFGFAALQRLFIPFMDTFDQLPRPQREALGSAFGLVDGPPPDRFLVGLAALTQLAAAAEEQPLVCVIDVAQWVDRESLDSLAFVGRRLHADKLALFFAVRTGPGVHIGLDGLPELEVGPLPEAGAIELLESAASTLVDPAVAQRIVAATGAWPLAVTEVARLLSPAQLHGTDVLPDPLPITGRLEQYYLSQVDRLPAETRLLLLVAAAEPVGSAEVVRRAADQLGITMAAAEPLEDGDLVAISARVEFRHPLIRSAVYGGAAPSERRRVHRVLATVDDSEARAWHLAAASVGPDEDVAQELERAAQEAHLRGRYAGHAALLSRAAELTPDPSTRARRLLAAAQLHQTAGSPSAARSMLDEVAHDLADPVLRAQATRLRAALGSYTVPAKIPAVLLAAARELESLDLRLARETYSEALDAVMVSGQLTIGTTPDEVARAASAASVGAEAPTTLSDLMISAYATRLGVGYVEAVEPLRRFVAALRAGDLSHPGFARWSASGANAAVETWDADGYRALLLGLERYEREQGALDALRISLGGLGHCDMWAGKFTTAEARHDEATAISVALGAPSAMWELLKVELFAWQGRERETRAIIELLTDRGPKFAGVAVNLALVAGTILDLGLGAYESALTTGWQLFESDSPPQGTQILADLVEAAVRTGDLDRAARAHERLAERARVSGTPWAVGTLARAEALLAPDDAAEDHYRESIANLERTYVRTDLARVHLLFGEWLRRQQRRTEAREELRTTHELFSGMGARAFAERTRIELAATGERARSRAVAAGTELTPQESQIGGLAAGGATNSEIAARLFLSPATIDYHLRKVYRKLGVSSRRELRRALPADETVDYRDEA